MCCHHRAFPREAWPDLSVQDLKGTQVKNLWELGVILSLPLAIMALIGLMERLAGVEWGQLLDHLVIASILTAGVVRLFYS